MSETQCPFCGSKTVLVKTGKWERVGMELVEKRDFCCLSQKRNASYASSHKNRDGIKPSAEEVAEL